LISETKVEGSCNSSSSWTLTLDYDELQCCCIDAINARTLMPCFNIVGQSCQGCSRLAV